MIKRIKKWWNRNKRIEAKLDSIIDRLAEQKQPNHLKDMTVEDISAKEVEWYLDSDKDWILKIGNAKFFPPVYKTDLINMIHEEVPLSIRKSRALVEKLIKQQILVEHRKGRYLAIRLRDQEPFKGE